MQRHLGSHQQHLALFALPANLDDTEDEPNDDDGEPILAGNDDDEELSDLSDTSDTEEVHDIAEPEFEDSDREEDMHTAQTLPPANAAQWRNMPPHYQMPLVAQMGPSMPPYMAPHGLAQEGKSPLGEREIQIIQGPPGTGKAALHPPGLGIFAREASSDIPEEPIIVVCETNDELDVELDGLLARSPHMLDDGTPTRVEVLNTRVSPVMHELEAAMEGLGSEPSDKVHAMLSDSFPENLRLSASPSSSARRRELEKGTQILEQTMSLEDRGKAIRREEGKSSDRDSKELEKQVASAAAMDQESLENPAHNNEDLDTKVDIRDPDLSDARYLDKIIHESGSATITHEELAKRLADHTYYLEKMRQSSTQGVENLNNASPENKSRKHRVPTTPPEDQSEHDNGDNHGDLLHLDQPLIPSATVGMAIPSADDEVPPPLPPSGHIEASEDIPNQRDPSGQRSEEVPPPPPTHRQVPSVEVDEDPWLQRGEPTPNTTHANPQSWAETIRSLYGARRSTRSDDDDLNSENNQPVNIRTVQPSDSPETLLADTSSHGIAEELHITDLETNLEKMERAAFSAVIDHGGLGRRLGTQRRSPDEMGVADEDLEVENMPANSAGAPQQGNHALRIQEYQRQVMLLEQQNKRPLLKARQEQVSQPGPHQQRDIAEPHEKHLEAEYGDTRHNEDQDGERLEQEDKRAAIFYEYERDKVLAALDKDRREQLHSEDHEPRGEHPISGPDERDFTEEDEEYDIANSHANMSEEQKVAVEQRQRLLAKLRQKRKEQEMRREPSRLDEYRSSRGHELRNGSDDWDFGGDDEWYTSSRYTAGARHVRPDSPQPPSRRAYLQAESYTSTFDTSPGDSNTTATRGVDASPVTESPKFTESRETDQTNTRLRLEEERRKQEEKAEYEAMLRQQREKQKEEERKKEEQERELEETMRNRLIKFGFEGDQLEALLSPDKGKQNEQEAGPAQLAPAPPTPWAKVHRTHLPAQLATAAPPTYAKVHRTHLDVETLHYYDIPYEYDVNPEYIIVLREMSQRETDILFEHTRRLRTGHRDRIVAEEPGKDGRGKEHAFVRKKSGTRSRSVGVSGNTGKREVNDSASRPNVSLGDKFFR
jgi:hypothetical protein